MNDCSEWNTIRWFKLWMLDTSLYVEKTKSCTISPTMSTEEEVLNVRLTFFTVVMKIIKLICDQNDFKEGNIAKSHNKICAVSLITQFHPDYTVNDWKKLMGMTISELKSISDRVRQEQGIAEKQPPEIYNAINLSSDFEKEKQKLVIKDDTKNKRDVSDLANYITPAKKKTTRTKNPISAKEKWILK